MGFFKSIGRAFKSIATDILPPAILGIAGGPVFGPYLAAAYSGIKTGVETGSPFAGIGSAAMSFGLAQIGQGLRGKGPAALDTTSLAPTAGQSAIEPVTEYGIQAGYARVQDPLTGGLKIIKDPTRIASGVGFGTPVNTVTGEILSTSPNLVSSRSVSQFAPEPTKSLFQRASDLGGKAVDIAMKPSIFCQFSLFRNRYKIFVSKILSSYRVCFKHFCISTLSNY